MPKAMKNKKTVNHHEIKTKLELENKTKIIAVTGGKGGTGKTLVAIGLANFLCKSNRKVLLVDCDVDSPNIALLLNVKLENKGEVHCFQPNFDKDKCQTCGECQKACPENAILITKQEVPYLFSKLCSGCGACKIVCPYMAIEDSFKVIGWTYEGQVENIDIISGELKIPEPNSAEVVKEVKKRMLEKNQNNKYDYIIIDTSPGAHCDVIRALADSDIAIAVTEPTSFGYHDLELILKLLDKIKIKSKIIINRYNLVKNFDSINNLLKKYNSSILGKIPVDQSILEKYVNQDLLNVDKDISSGFKEIYGITNKLKQEFE
jgi:MinD superfamily P-loop ATPase